MSWHPRGRYVQVHRRRVHCVDVGEGPPVVLLHGFLHSGYTGRATVEALAERHRVIVPDLLGYGRSCKGPADRSLAAQAEWLVALLEGLGVDSVQAGIGNSWGGAVLLQVALQDPSWAQRLVLVSPLGAPLPLPDLALRALGHRSLRPVFRLTAASRTFQRAALGLTAYKGRRVDGEVLAGFAHLTQPGSHKVAVETARQFRPAGRALRDALPRLQTPATLVWGKRDRILPLRYGKKVALRLPHERFEVFEDCGHCPHEEQPERWLQLLERELALPEPQGLILPGPRPVRLGETG
jgi:pimeloyl-ACP methyl ester carboxylesterase